MATPTATIFVPYHAVDELHQRGPRAAQPAASAVTPGTLYGVTDEGDLVERSSGSAWERYGIHRSASLSLYDFSATTTAPPTLNQLRIDAGAPYTTATRLFVRYTTSDGVDIYRRLALIPVGITLLVQDKNDHTVYAKFTMTGSAIDQTTYFELPVSYITGSGSFVNNQAVALVEVD